MNAIQYFDWGGYNNDLTMNIDILYTKEEYRNILKDTFSMELGNTPQKTLYKLWRDINRPLGDYTAEEIRRNIPALGNRILKSDLPSVANNAEKNIFIKLIQMLFLDAISVDNFYKIMSTVKVWVNGSPYTVYPLFSNNYPRSGFSGAGFQINMENISIKDIHNHHLNIKIQI